MLTTPKHISEPIKNFLKTLGITDTPIFLPFTRLSHTYKPMYCLDNCEAENRHKGTEMIFGWMIWEDPSTSFIEAEFHAVIKRSNSLLDITPRVDGENKILFSIDPLRIATRIDSRTWHSWENHKSINGRIVQRTFLRDYVDSAKLP